jgi:CRP/FNR family transcriptional regulator
MGEATDMAAEATTLPSADQVSARSVFAALGAADLAYARLHARRRQVLAGTLLFLEGDSCAGLYLVQHGALRLFTANAGKEQTLRIVRSGEVCNAFAACGGPNLTSAEAMDDSEVLVLAASHVAYLFNHSDGFARALIAAMAGQMRHFVALVGDLSFHHVIARVAKVLLQSLAPSPGVGAGSGGRSLTQQELADLVGTAREVVARSLRALADAGAIGMTRDGVVILDRRLLEAAATEASSQATEDTAPAHHPRPSFGPLPRLLVSPLVPAPSRAATVASTVLDAVRRAPAPPTGPAAGMRLKHVGARVGASVARGYSAS